MKTVRLISLLTLAFSCLVSAHAVTISTVPVRDLGNPSDGVLLHGGVSYAYNIGKYEVTVGQYTEFLNAVAATDTYDLYYNGNGSGFDIGMRSPVNSRIIRSGMPGSYTYSAIDSLNRPVTHVGWGDAARFANWLHNGQPTGPQDSSTTEDGAYKLDGKTGLALASVTRSAIAKWFLPTEDEWYKAAYYQPTALGGDSDGYWSYPMKNNDGPYSDQPPGATPDNTRVGNFKNIDDDQFNGYDDGYAATGSPSPCNVFCTTDVGAYASSPSYYGTLDQGGNVWEWLETPQGFTYRLQRGGSWGSSTFELNASQFSFDTPDEQIPILGFRVATIPEPSSIALCIVGVVMLTLRRRENTMLRRTWT